jgi:hypothetical protein
MATSAVFAAVTTLVICLPMWPGLMSYDSLYAYRQSIYGVESAVWPPMHDYLFYVSRKLTGGPGGLFATQIFLLFASASAIVSMFARDRRRHALGFVLFVASFVWFPTLLGTAIVNWKDVSLTTFSLLAVCLWLAAVRRSSRWLLILAAFSLCVAMSVRLNGLPLVLPFIVLLIVQPDGHPTARVRALGIATVGAAIIVGYATTVWRLPDLRRLPAPGGAFAGIQIWDLVGTSACVGESLLPPAYRGSGDLSIAELRALYDPRHSNLTLSPPVGVKPLPTPARDASEDVRTAWLSALRQHPGCYLRHRALVFAHLLGLTRSVFYPTHSGIDANPYGLRLRHPAAAERTIAFVTESTDQWPRRVVWLYLASAVMTVVALRRRWNSSAVVLILGLGAALYAASFFFLTPAADARYLFPSNIFCALLCVLGALALMDSRLGPRAPDYPDR